eukprot:scaffold25622_cov206-Cylindrotheca_fusiformis.AAC.1
MPEILVLASCPDLASLATFQDGLAIDRVDHIAFSEVAIEAMTFAAWGIGRFSHEVKVGIEFLGEV